MENISKNFPGKFIKVLIDWEDLKN